MATSEFKDSGNSDNSEAIDRLIELLEFETNRIRAEESQPGWTKWALMASLATILWLLSDELGTDTVNLQNVLFLLLALSLAYDCVTRLLPSTSTTSSRSASRFRLAYSVLSPMRSRVVTEIGRSAVLIVTATAIRSLLDTRYLVATYLFYGTWVFFMVIGFIYSFLKTPLPLGDYARPLPLGGYGRVVTAIRAFFLLPATFALFGYVEALSRHIVSPTVPEYRIAGLLLTATIVLLFLTKKHSQTPLLETLVEIRRNLALEKTGLDSARRQTEIALLGMKVDDVLQDALKEILSDLQHMGILLEGMTKEHRAIVAAVGEHNDKATEDQLAPIKEWIASAEDQITPMDDWTKSVENVSAAIEYWTGWTASVKAHSTLIDQLVNSEGVRITLLETLEDSTGAHLAELDELMERFSDKYDRFERRTLTLTKVIGDSSGEIVAVRTKIITALQEVRSRHKHLREQREIITELNHHFRERNKAYTNLMNRVTQTTEERRRAFMDWQGQLTKEATNPVKDS